MRTATLFLLCATIRVFAAQQDTAGPKQAIAQAQKSQAQKSQSPQKSADRPTLPRFEAVPADVAPGHATQLTGALERATHVNLPPGAGDVPGDGPPPATPR